MKRGFTLIEMLVVIGIIAALVAASMTTYSSITARAQAARAQELVSNTLTALVQVMQVNDAWPSVLLAEGGGGRGELTPEAGAPLAKCGALTLSYREYTDETTGESRCVLSGPDKFGILDTWARDVVKAKMKSSGVSLSTSVPSGGTIQDHRLRFAVDDDYDGRVRVSGDGVSATVRASAAVWGAGRDGKFGTKDDLKSWSKGQEE